MKRMKKYEGIERRKYPRTEYFNVDTHGLTPVALKT
jgi:hypothetical protein